MHKCLYCYKENTEGGDFHAHCAAKFFGTKVIPVMPYALDEMSELAKQVVERSISITGVQPKLSMSMLNSNKEHRLTVVGALGGDYIFKPPNVDYPEMPENEHLTMLLAQMFGITTVPSTLIRLQSGELSYLTKRIDRLEGGKKVHMLDMFQITEAFDKYKSSHEKVGKAILAYASNTQFDVLRYFELVVFSYLVGNNDMHLKNFSLIKNDDGWGLAPAYDLLNVNIVLPDDKEELALTLGGKKSHFSKTHFLAFGKSLNLTEKQMSGVFARFEKKKTKAFDRIKSSFLSLALQSKYIELMNERYSVF